MFRPYVLVIFRLSLNLSSNNTNPGDYSRSVWVGERDLVFIIVGALPWALWLIYNCFIMVPYCNHINNKISLCLMNQKKQVLQ